MARPDPGPPPKMTFAVTKPFLEGDGTRQKVLFRVRARTRAEALVLAVKRLVHG
jgi:hypothetical protein